MNEFRNPFPDSDGDRHAIWQMLVERDIAAFCAANWDLVAGDFVTDGFHGLDARGRSNPDFWCATFPTVDSYRNAWLAEARRVTGLAEADDIRGDLHDATLLRDIEVNGDRAVAHKKFDGWLRLAGGRRERLSWQSLYQCRRQDGRWLIGGFVGYLPLIMDEGRDPVAGKQLPEGATQHSTAGPYSPALRVGRGELVVISGQAAIADDGSIIGDSLEEQAEATLENCRRQLRSAGCDLADVFKVNVYLTDLSEWAAFNDVYRRLVPEPRPVRTAVGTKLLPGLKVEVEMWAVKP
jgi:enamine deaminase RidA (YjgF/YER057c/UK114 family)